MPNDIKIYGNHDIDDNVIMNVLTNTCEVLDVTFEQAAKTFGNYWMNESASKTYFAFFHRSKSAKEFLLAMDSVHEKVTDKINNANPPGFEYEDVDKNTLIMTYKSKRGLEQIWIGLIKGVGDYYKENIEVIKLSKKSVKINFN